MPRFSRKSRSKLEGVDARLVLLLEEVVKYFDITVIEGKRSQERQNQLVKEGKSKTKFGKHVQGMAVDIIYSEGPSSEVFNWAITKLPAWSQIIWEFPEKGQFSSGNINSSWIHIAYNQDNNPKITSLSSDRKDLHAAYNGERRGIYTHGITTADQSLI